LKKVVALSGFGNDADRRFFILAKNAVIESCNCEIRVIVPDIVFLTTDVPMVIRAGEKVDFGRVAEKEIGLLLQKMANLRGRENGSIMVSQDADNAYLQFTEWSAKRGDLVRSIDLLLKNMFGFHFIKRVNYCEKCACDAIPDKIEHSECANSGFGGLLEEAIAASVIMVALRDMGIEPKLVILEMRFSCVPRRCITEGRE